MRESLIQSAILEFLAAKGVFALRMNTGAFAIEKRFMRFGIPGQADIIAFPIKTCGEFYSPCPSDEDDAALWQQRHCRQLAPRILWIEVKSEKGRQSELQKSFQKHVEERGHLYILAHSIDDVEAVL